MNFLLILSILPLLITAQQVVTQQTCGYRDAPSCDFGYICVANYPTDFTGNGTGGFCQRSLCPCPNGFECDHGPTGTDAPFCREVACGGSNTASCPSGSLCTNWGNSTLGGFCVPIPTINITSLPSSIVNATGESCAGTALVGPDGCPAGKVCVDKVDPAKVTDSNPGASICINQVNCGGLFGDLCPDGWQCSTVNGEVGHCEFNFNPPIPVNNTGPDPEPPFDPNSGGYQMCLGWNGSICPSGKVCVPVISDTGCDGTLSPSDCAGICVTRVANNETCGGVGMSGIASQKCKSGTCLDNPWDDCYPRLDPYPECQGICIADYPVDWLGSDSGNYRRRPVRGERRRAARPVGRVTRFGKYTYRG